MQAHTNQLKDKRGYLDMGWGTSHNTSLVFGASSDTSVGPFCTTPGVASECENLRWLSGYQMPSKTMDVAALNVVCGPHLIRDSLGQSIPQSKRHHDRFSRFRLGDRRVSLYFTMGCPSPIKIAPSHGGSWPSSSTWFLGPNQVFNINGISFGSAISAGLTSVTDRQTDRPETTVLGL